MVDDMKMLKYTPRSISSFLLPHLEITWNETSGTILYLNIVHSAGAPDRLLNALRYTEFSQH